MKRALAVIYLLMGVSAWAQTAELGRYTDAIKTLCIPSSDSKANQYVLTLRDEDTETVLRFSPGQMKAFRLAYKDAKKKASKENLAKNIDPAHLPPPRIKKFGNVSCNYSNIVVAQTVFLDMSLYPSTEGYGKNSIGVPVAWGSVIETVAGKKYRKFQTDFEKFLDITNY